ncbi:putative sodium/bile acid cotransporter-like [Scophthalmus maximus]|uniref:Putative sodium/bile acid cotransporter-like n=1 Tax=Scophthalmus maximus TaxID=52904 RepID=A0A2U9CUA2_SCOMX|nr:putative sodium/bile acid cotransporter-like [Scophthalmus maximus]
MSCSSRAKQGHPRNVAGDCPHHCDNEGTVDDTADMVSGPDLWQNNSVSFNTSSATTVTLSPILDKTLSMFAIVFSINTMISLGCAMDWSKIKNHVIKPKGVAIALVSQYGVMPLTGFCLAKAFQLSGITATVILICGCSPGGQLSNLMTLALQGDVTLSMVMTSCSMFMALGMMPLLLYLYCKGFPNLHKAVPYGSIILSLFLTTICSGLGILINHFRPQYSKTITKVGLSISLVASVGIIMAVGFNFGVSILLVLSPPLVATAALMPFIGYVFGYIISSVCRLNQAERRTVAMETGCQQIQLCITILKIVFPPATMGPLFIFPILLLAFQLIESGVIVALFKAHQRFTPKEKGETDPLGF